MTGAVIYEGTAADSIEVKQDILERICNGRPAPQQPARLPLGDIVMVPALFQPRSGGEWQSDAHLRTLAGSVNNAKELTGKAPLKAVVVFWIGDAWACIDGHHRLAAVRGPLRANRSATIGVEVFTGTLAEAMLEATRRNSETKLPMTDADRSERAWQLFLLGAGTHAAIGGACIVSTKSLQRMAQAVRRHGQTPEGASMLHEMSWFQVRMLMNGEQKGAVDMDTRMDEKVRRHAEALSKVIKSNSPALVAAALIRRDPEHAREIQRILKEQLDPENPFTSGVDGLPQFPEEGGEF